jgi:hypothetical protein
MLLPTIINNWSTMSKILLTDQFFFFFPENFIMILVNSTPLYILNICEVCGSYQCHYCPYYSQTAPFAASKFITVVLLITLQLLKTFKQFTWQWNHELKFQLSWQKLKKYICGTTIQQSTLHARVFCGMLFISILQFE